MTESGLSHHDQGRDSGVGAANGAPGTAPNPAAAPTDFGESVIQFWSQVISSFLQNRCPVRASALAYTTLLALVPLLAVVLSVSASMLKQEGEKPIEAFIDQMVSNIAPQLNLEVKAGDTAGAARRQDVVRNIRNYIANIRSGTLGTTGMIGLVFVAIMLLSNIEATFNDIWGVSRGRAWISRVVNYWAAITLGPIILVVVLGLTSGPYLQASQVWVARLPMSFQVGFQLLFRFVPFLLLASSFAMFYAFMPNARVPFKAALVGGLLGGVLWQLNNLFNIIYVSNVVAYSKIYGSFGMVPIFLVGMYLSWIILLFGAQVAYTYQHRTAYIQQIESERIHFQGREFVALRVMTLVARGFDAGQKPPTAANLADGLGVSPHLISQTLRVLTASGLLVEVAGADPGYTLARAPAQITAAHVLQALRTVNGVTPLTRTDDSRDCVENALQRIRTAEAATAGALTLESLARERIAPEVATAPRRQAPG